MSAVQATIPFKVKKKVNINLKKDKIVEDALKKKQKLRRKNEDYELTYGTENGLNFMHTFKFKFPCVQCPIVVIINLYDGL